MAEKLPFFVYGTLMTGFRNHNYLLEGRTRIIVNASAKGTMFSVGGFPALIESPMDGEIKGELAYIQPDKYERVMKELDGLEGYYERFPERSMYLRKKTTVMTAGGAPVEAWVYYWNRSIERLEHVPEGDWREFEKKRYSFYA